jgi:FkbM family methyltransferase
MVCQGAATHLQRHLRPPQVELRPGGTVIDVGANSGMFALFAAGALGSSGRVVAVEPSPDSHACLEANATAHAAWSAAAGAAPVEPLQAACGDGSSDMLTLVMYDNVSTLNTVIPDHAAAHAAMQVQAWAGCVRNISEGGGAGRLPLLKTEEACELLCGWGFPRTAARPAGLHPYTRSCRCGCRAAPLFAPPELH